MVCVGGKEYSEQLINQDAPEVLALLSADCKVDLEQARQLRDAARKPTA
jgi:hypothetical protein